MIPLSFQGGLLVYFFVWLLVLTILWAREVWRIQKHDWAQHVDRLCVCDSCHLAFMVKPDINITRCPRCNQMCILRLRQKS